MKEPKKSETLEVRLSHQDKLALQDKAASEGRTVSAVIRGLISSYLSQSEPRSTPSRLSEPLMTLKSRPKTVLATLACLPLLSLPMLMASPANAADIGLTLGAEYIQPVIENGIEGKRVRRFGTDIEMGLDEFIAMRLPSTTAQWGTSTLFMTAQVTEAQDLVTINLTICEIDGDIAAKPNEIELTHFDGCEFERILVNPSLTAKFGEKIEFKMGDKTGMSFALSASLKLL